MNLAHVQGENRYDTLARIAEAYLLVFGREGLDRIPFEREELQFHEQALAALKVEWDADAVYTYFWELRLQLKDDRRPYSYDFLNRKAEQDARRFFVDRERLSGAR